MTEEYMQQVLCRRALSRGATSSGRHGSATGSLQNDRRISYGYDGHARQRLAIADVCFIRLLVVMIALCAEPLTLTLAVTLPAEQSRFMDSTNISVSLADPRSRWNHASYSDSQARIRLPCTGCIFARIYCSEATTILGRLVLCRTRALIARTLSASFP